MSGTGELPAVPAGHPDHDLLADLAAEVLAADLAEQVESHVVGCPSCAGLLAEAEGIRSLLRQGEPDVMPDDVLERLELALAASSPSVSSASATSPASAAPPASATDAPAPRKRLTPAIPRAAANGETPSRLSRMRPTNLGARRQALEEQRADRPSLLTRAAPALKIAASVIVLLGVGGFLWQLFTGPGQSATTASGSSAGSAAAAPVLAQVQTSDTNYSERDLQKQVDALIAADDRTTSDSATSSGSTGSGSTGSGSTGSGSTGSGSTSSAERAPAVKSAPVAPLASGATATDDLLRSPAALRACLSAIGADDEQPVAVDLARYADREAAIIVLNADGGGYDVWVVARTCAPDADGTIANVHLNS